MKGKLSYESYEALVESSNNFPAEEKTENGMQILLFLDAFAKLTNATISFVVSAVRMEQLSSLLTDFYGILHLSVTGQEEGG